MVLAELWGAFICVDENTSKGDALDVARIMVKVPLSFKSPDFLIVNIDGLDFKLTIREDALSQFHSNAGNSKSYSSDIVSSNSKRVGVMINMLRRMVRGRKVLEIVLNNSWDMK